MRKLFLMLVVLTMIIGCGRRTIGYENESKTFDDEYDIAIDDGQYDSVVDVTISGLELEREVNVTDAYEGIDASGAWHVMLSDSVQVPTIVADEVMMPYLKVVVEDGDLKVSYLCAIHYRGKINGVPVLKVPSNVQLKKIELSGASKFESIKPIQGDSLLVEMEGASKADIDASNIAQYIEVELAGACKTMLNCNVKQLDIDVAGASKLELKGKAELFNIDMAGACKVTSNREKKRYQFEADEANLDMAGASKIEFHCNKKLNVDAVGAGSVKYTGEPSISNDVAGMVSVKRVK